LAEEKMFGQLKKMHLKKECYTLTEIEEIKNVDLDLCGY
jgi:hypothetical protein